MSSEPSPRSLRRARWLAELDEALEEAHKLTLRLVLTPGSSTEATALRNRIRAAQSQVDALRRGSFRPADGDENPHHDPISTDHLFGDATRPVGDRPRH